MEQTDSTTIPPTHNPHPHLSAIYSANIVQLFLGIIITISNALVAFAIASRPRLKTSTNLLLGNICFVNLIVGVMLSVANVTDGWREVNLLKTESSLVVVDCFVNIATILALVTNTFMAIRSPAYHMTSKNCIKIIFGIWAAVLFLCLVKAVVFSLDRLNYSTACYSCFVVFEIVTLTIFSISTGVIFTAALYVVVSRRKRAVVDQDSPAPNARNREFAIMITAGILMIAYFVCFVIFVLMYVAWMANKNSVTPATSDLILCIFFLHAVVNPFIIAIRHKDLRDNIKSMICCCCAEEDDEIQNDAPENQNGHLGNQNGGVELSTTSATRDAFLRPGSRPDPPRGPGRVFSSDSMGPTARVPSAPPPYHQTTPPGVNSSPDPETTLQGVNSSPERIRTPATGVRLAPLEASALAGETTEVNQGVVPDAGTEAQEPPVTTV